MDFLNMENATKIFAIVTGVVGTFALIATLTPNKADDRIAQVILDVVNFLGGNIGRAANKGDDPDVGPSDDPTAGPGIKR